MVMSEALTCISGTSLAVLSCTGPTPVGTAVSDMELAQNCACICAVQLDETEQW